MPPAQRQWVKPADFRPAEDTAIHEAVAHATFIANALKELHDQMDEVLKLVEIAERQKLADEREIDELRRALRRIQPQNRRNRPPANPGVTSRAAMNRAVIIASKINAATNRAPASRRANRWKNRKARLHRRNRNSRLRTEFVSAP
jgi:multidrug resistance efflux pump